MHTDSNGPIAFSFSNTISRPYQHLHSCLSRRRCRSYNGVAATSEERMHHYATKSPIPISNNLVYSVIDGDNDDDNNEPSSGGGVYIDLGSIPFDEKDNDGSIEMERDDNNPYYQVQSQRHNNTTTIEEWRSHHWITLVDDEPAIRLAIGDYLHSMGYSVITACDGPMAFLEVLLWSCSWSLLGNNEEQTEGGGEGQEPEQERQRQPPWIVDGGGEGENYSKWRLPDCVISDIRMPGGIDGVQLLELLRRSTPVVADAAAAGKDMEKISKKKKKKNTGGTKKEDKTAVNIYDAKDDFELLDAIVAGGGDASRNERIATPIDQAMHYLNAIRGCIRFLAQDPSTKGQKKEQAKQQYHPSSLQQMPVILLTAKAMVSDRIVGYEAGANGYLPKPFRPEELLGMVDNLMRKQEREQNKSILYAKNDGAVTTGNVVNRDILDLTPEEVKDITKDLTEIRQALGARAKRMATETQRTEDDDLVSLLPEAMRMLEKGERRKRVLTKAHIRSILALQFGVIFPRNDRNTRREVLMAKLEEQIASHPEKLESGQGAL
mmetsp:Transcript_5936/g.11412  ORF Transcript_5936/g.11412 Transcript_5936/m.11412 type:complete len:549 (+) Transcript_5936:38-1684(+)